MKKLIAASLMMLFVVSTQAGPRKYRSGGTVRIQKGYTRKNGTYVRSHYKTNPDNTKSNNLGRRK